MLLEKRLRQVDDSTSKSSSAPRLKRSKKTETEGRKSIFPRLIPSLSW
jgi:hypothetical protein